MAESHLNLAKNVYEDETYVNAKLALKASLE